MYHDLIKAEETAQFTKIAATLGVKIHSLKSHKNLKLVEGKNDEIIRKAVEQKNTDILLNPHQDRERDFMHYRDAGLNQVVCKLAHKNKIAIGFTYDKLYGAKDLGKVMQNIKLCRKYNVRVVFLSLATSPYQLRSPKDLMSLGKVLGMHPSEAKEAVTALGEILKSKSI